MLFSIFHVSDGALARTTISATDLSFLTAFVRPFHTVSDCATICLPYSISSSLRDLSPVKEGTLEMVRRAVWGMLYADDAGVVSTSPRGLTRMMGVIVVTCQEFGLTVSEKKTEAMHLWSHPHTTSNALRIEAAGQRYKQTTEFVYLGGAISESADLDIEIKRRIGAAWASVRKYSSQLYDRRNARLSLKNQAFQSGGNGSYAVRMCHVDYALPGL